MAEIGDEHEVELINAIESISSENLKLTSHKKYATQIVQVATRALKIDGTRLMLLLESIKSCRQACYKRDLLLDVLKDLIVSDEVLIECLLCRPFPSVSHQIPWKELANAIATIPDLAANCDAQTRIPLFKPDVLHRRILEAMYESFGVIATQQRDHPTEEHKMYLLQILGRIAFSESALVWTLVTSRAIRETRLDVKSAASSLFLLASTAEPIHANFEIFMERLHLPIFYSLKPCEDSGHQIYSILGDGALINDHLRYLICDKSIFKANYRMDRQRQSALLFNISAYLSSLVIYERASTSQAVGTLRQSENKCSLLMQTLLEILRQWASATKALLRTYEQSLHVSAALMVMFRYAIKHDKDSLSEHANQIQSMLVAALPMYLNRGSREQRDLAMCVGKLLLPKLRELMTDLRADGGCTEQSGELDLNYDIEPHDDLLYLQRLFKHDIEVIFQDFSEPSGAKALISEPENALPSTTIRSNNARPSSATSLSSSSAVSHPPESGRERQLRKSTSDGPDASDAAASTKARPIVSELDIDYENARRDRDQSMDASLKPHASGTAASVEVGDDGDDDTDDEYDLGADPLDVPIYLRDCINGLAENNNHRYVRLCLAKAGGLIDQLITQDALTRDRQMLTNHKSVESTRVVDSQATRSELSLQSARNGVGINATIKDDGVELARTLLFLEDQFKIKGFKQHRMGALVSLCVAAPQLVGRYLLEEFNGSNRSMSQQLDILQALMESAKRLSTPAKLPDDGSGGGGGGEQSQEAVAGVGAMAKSVATRRGEQHWRTNGFAAHAALYLYGIVHRLKADFVDNKSLVIAQPRSILSAFRELKCQSAEQSHQAGALSVAGAAKLGRASLEQLKSTITSLKNDIDRDDDGGDGGGDGDGDVDTLLERNSLSDDSYLLSRIMLATASILGCASQQPVACKLSSDLLKVLAAYRCHPDSGVQRAMIVNLRAIRASTPRVYYENFIEPQMVQMFGPWLARLDES